MVTTRSDVQDFVSTMPDIELARLRDIINEVCQVKDAQRIAAEKRFVMEVQAAEDAIAQGAYVTSSQLRERLGIMS